MTDSSWSNWDESDNRWMQTIRRGRSERAKDDEENRRRKRQRDEKQGGTRRSSKKRRSAAVDNKRSVLATRMGESIDPSKVKLARARRRRRSKHQMAVFFSCHGGTGSTVLTTNVGATLARAGRRTCVLDLDLQFGDALATLNLRSRCSIAELMNDDSLRDGDRLDRELVLTRLPRHASGLFVVSQVGDVEGLADIDVEGFGDLVRELRRCFEFVIVDGARDFGDLPLCCLDQANRVALVATQDLSTLRGLVMRLDIFRRLGHEFSDLRFIVNRFSRRNGIPLDAIAAAVELEPSFVVDEDFKLTHRAINEGKPLAELNQKAQISQDIALIVEEMFGIATVEERSGILGRLFGGGK